MSGTKRKSKATATVPAATTTATTIATESTEAAPRVCVLCSRIEPKTDAYSPPEHFWSEHSICGERFCSDCIKEHSKTCEKLQEEASKLMWMAPWPANSLGKIGRSVWEQAIPDECCTVEDSHGDADDGETGDPLVNNIAFDPTLPKSKLPSSLLAFIDEDCLREEGRVDGREATLAALDVMPALGQVSFCFATEKRSTYARLSALCQADGIDPEVGTHDEDEEEPPIIEALVCFTCDFVLLPVGVKHVNQDTPGIDYRLVSAIENALENEEAEEEEEPDTKKQKGQDGQETKASKPTSLPDLSPTLKEITLGSTGGFPMVRYLLENPADAAESYEDAVNDVYEIHDATLRRDWGHLKKGSTLPWILFNLEENTIEFVVNGQEAYKGQLRLVLWDARIDKILPNDS